MHILEQRDKLREALARLIGASRRDELEALELGVMILNKSEEDRDVALNAIQVLKDCDDRTYRIDEAANMRKRIMQLVERLQIIGEFAETCNSIEMVQVRELAYELISNPSTRDRK